jgi:hypothetical protein
MKPESPKNIDLFGIFGALSSSIYRFDIDYFFNLLKEIESELGELDLIPKIHKLPPNHQSAIMRYYAERIIAQSMTLLRHVSGVKSDIPLVIDKRKLVSSDNIHYPPESNKPPDLKAKLLNEGIIDLKSILQYPLTNQLALERYMVSFEFFIESFIDPIFKNLKSKKRIPQSVYNKFNSNSSSKFKKKWPNHLKIEAVQFFFENTEKLKPLSPLIEDLDASLRNSLIHESYFIDEQVLHYFQPIYQAKGQFKEKKMDIQRLHIKNTYQIFRSLLLMTLIAMKYGDQIKIKEKLGIK